MINITKKEINNKLQNVLLRYEEVLEHFSHYKTEKGFLSLDSLRKANSEVYDCIFYYTGRDINNKFQESPDNINEKYSMDKKIEDKINENQVKLFESIRRIQEKKIKEQCTSQVLIRLYIERYLPLIWNKELDLLLICNIDDHQLLEELINTKQKNIFVLNQQCENVNSFIKEKSKSNNGLKLINSLTGNEVVDFFRYQKTKFNNSQYCLWHNFQNNLNNSIDLKEANETKSKLKIIKSKVFAKTSDRYKTLWVKNGLNNLNNLKVFPNINKFNNKFYNQSVVVICPGPSLKNDIKYLKNLNKRFFVCAVGHSLGILNDNKIIPDMVIHIDPLKSDWAEKTFNNYDFANIKLLLLGSTCDKDLFNKNAKNIAWLSVNNLYDNWIHDVTGEKNTFLNCINVSHVTLSLLVKFGFSNITFVGLDHAFIGNHFYTGSSTNNQKDNISFGKAEQEVLWKSKTEGVVKTNNLFVNSILTFEKLLNVTLSNNKHINIFNSTSQGALIKGFKNISIADFIRGKHTEKSNFLDTIKNSKICRSDKLNETNMKNFFFNLQNETTKVLNLLKNIIHHNDDYYFTNKFIKEANMVINIITHNSIFALISHECFVDYNQRKNLFNNREESLLKLLLVNLQNTFDQFSKFQKHLNT